MTIVFVTLTFLIAAWAGAFSLLAILDDSGAKMLAALKGQSLSSCEPLPLRQVTVRFSARPIRSAQPMRAQAEWRAAA